MVAHAPRKSRKPSKEAGNRIPRYHATLAPIAPPAHAPPPEISGEKPAPAGYDADPWMEAEERPRWSDHPWCMAVMIVGGSVFAWAVVTGLFVGLWHAVEWYVIRR